MEAAEETQDIPIAVPAEEIKDVPAVEVVEETKDAAIVEGEEEIPTIPPVIVIYCGICKLPSEFCEFGPCFERCKSWIARNCPELYP
jgi:density-regulated protein DRP1